MRSAARGGAASAELREFFIAGLIASFRASITNFRAGAAGDLVQFRMTEHKVVRGVSYLGAVEQYANMFRARVRASFFQAIVNSMLARIVDVLAGVNAFIHFRCLMFVNVWHILLFFGLFYLREIFSLRGDRLLKEFLPRPQFPGALLARLREQC